MPIAVHTGPAGGNRHSGVFQEPCDYAGECLFGCRTQSKNTLDLTYIPMGETKYGLEVFALHSVENIEAVSSGGYRVHFTRLAPDNPAATGEPGVVAGERVVVSAGSRGGGPAPPQVP